MILSAFSAYERSLLYMFKNALKRNFPFRCSVNKVTPASQTGGRLRNRSNVTPFRAVRDRSEEAAHVTRKPTNTSNVTPAVQSASSRGGDSQTVVTSHSTSYIFRRPTHPGRNANNVLHANYPMGRHRRYFLYHGLETVSSTYTLMRRYNHPLSRDATIMVSKTAQSLVNTLLSFS